jgi:polygalacturonase
VEIPAGEYLSGPIQLVSHLNLKLDEGAMVKMLPMEQYPGGLKNPPNFIEADKLTDIAITGKGTIDGQGTPWWPFAKTKPEARRPKMIAIRGCQKVLIENVTLKDSPMFHIAMSGISDVTVSGITVRAPASTDPKNPSHNTDACDVSGSHILIKNCDISVGDDNFTTSGNTSDVLITHCKYGYGHGVSIGSHTRGGITNLTVDNCSFENTEAGIRIKSDRDRGGIIQYLSYKNLTMKNVGFPILIYGSYNSKDKDFKNLKDITPEIASKYPSAAVSERTPVYKNITFENITATAEKGRRAGLVWGLPEAPVENLVLKNVNITAEKPLGFCNVRGAKLIQCKIMTPEGMNKLAIMQAEISNSD